LGLALALPAPALASHGPSYRGHYVNAFLAGETAGGRDVAVMAGVHTDFPYHDRGSTYDQVAVLVEGSRPVVVTARPSLRGLRIALGRRSARLAYSNRRVALDLELSAVEHVPRYHGDPADLGDLVIGMGYEPSEESPGFVYTPYELVRLNRGALRVRGQRVRLARLHGQAEAGRIQAPDDPRFQSAYDYLAAPTLSATRGYTYVAFDVRALHSGLDGALGPYFHETGSDEFTLEGGRLASGNPHGAPPPFNNTRRLPAGAKRLARWAVDLGPGVLNRAIVRLRDRAGRRLIGLSETIKEDVSAD
jgi:hypothetical protein